MKAFVRNGLRFFPDGSKHANMVPAGEYLQALRSQQVFKVLPVQHIAGIVITTNIDTGLQETFLAKQVVTHLKTY